MPWIQAGGAIIGGVLGSRASKKAADAQLAAAREAAAVQREMFNKQVELQEPFRQAGITSQNKLMDLLGLSGNTGGEGYGSLAKAFTGEDMYNDPGYKFRLDEGLKSLERGAAARGGLLGGNQMRGLTEYGQNYASGEYQNAFNRYQAERAARLSPLQSLMGSGQTSATTLSNAAGNLGTQLGQNSTDVGNIRASGYIGGANALAGAIGQAANAYGNYKAQQQQQENFKTYMGKIG
jgi:hypothetical protein